VFEVTGQNDFKPTIRQRATEILPIPERYNYLPASKLDASVLDLAYLYHAFASSRSDNADHAPDFNGAVKLHKLIDVISIASESGSRRTVTS